MTGIDYNDKIAGSLLGCAIGDALGAPGEFQTPDGIKRQFGAAGITDFKQNFGYLSRLRAGSWTDDTHMALCLTRSIVSKGGVYPAFIRAEYVRWMRTGDTRGIGITVSRALTQGRAVAGEYAAGNGTAMRIAPIGLLYSTQNPWALPNVRRMAVDVRADATLTHSNEEAVDGAFITAYAIWLLACGQVQPENLIDILIRALGYFGTTRNLPNYLELALELLNDNVAPEEAARIIGTKGYIVPSVAAALYWFCKYPDDYAATVLGAANAGGDADTIAAIAGAISGAYNGLAKLPSRWVAGVEKSKYIQDLASQLAQRAGVV